MNLLLPQYTLVGRNGKFTKNIIYLLTWLEYLLSLKIDSQLKVKTLITFQEIGETFFKLTNIFFGNIAR